MTVNVVLTETSAQGETIEHHDRMKTFPDMPTAISALEKTVAELMKRAGMSYDQTASLEDNAQRYCTVTGDAFGWIIEQPDASPSEGVSDGEMELRRHMRREARSNAAWNIGYLLMFNAILALAAPTAERFLSILNIANPSTAALSIAIVRAVAMAAFLYVLAITVRRYFASRR